MPAHFFVTAAYHSEIIPQVYCYTFGEGGGNGSCWISACYCAVKGRGTE